MDSLWLGEHSHMPTDSVHPYTRDGRVPEIYRRLVDPFIALASVAVATDRLRIGTSISLVAEHSVLHLAKQVSTLDLMSDGRFELGVGYGWNKRECANNGVDPRHRQAVMTEKLEAMYRLWTDDVASYDGEHVQFTASWAWPKPVQRPHPPVLFGVPPTTRAFAEIARWGDGWMPLRVHLQDDPGDVLAKLRQAYEEIRVRPPSVTVFDPAGAMGGKRSIEAFRAHLPDPSLVAEFATHGVDRIVLGIPSDNVTQMTLALDEIARLRHELDDR